ncbi:MAG: UDP-N-acetylglucosamine 1-carboxyvinyltransferase [Phycisphaerales bacterium]
MDTFVIEGGRRLYGRVRINGSKNAALPMMAVPLLTDEPVTLRDVPDLADIRNMLRLLGELGCPRVNDGENAPKGVHTLHATDPTQSHARYDIVRTMRASICTLGPMLAKRGEARVSLPGGCAIGERPVDLHLRGLTALGAKITLDGGDIIAKSPEGGLVGATIFLGGTFGSTVLGTANVMSAATLARGTTIIESAACEPEIVDLANLLVEMGAKIRGAGSPRIIIEGVKELGGADYTVMADRIEAGTFIMAAAITNGDLTLENCPTDALLAPIYFLNAAGVHVQAVETLHTAISAGPRARSSTLTVTNGAAAAVAAIGGGDDPMRRTVRVTCDRVLRPVEITTQPHPGFPTDLQAQLMSLLCIADGNSVITERIFPDRFLHVAELSRMGAKLMRQGSTVIISGVRKLVGAPVMASDLRASAGLILAGMAAEGTTVVNRVYHLDRGYERMEDRLRMLGASIRRVDEKELSPGEVACAS